jgi:hypothetical protein
MLKRGEGVLCYHDGFRAAECNKGTLMELMAERLDAFFRNADFPIETIHYLEIVPHMGEASTGPYPTVVPVRANRIVRAH